MLEKTFINIKRGDQDDEDELNQHRIGGGTFSDPGTRKSSLCDSKPDGFLYNQYQDTDNNVGDSVIAVDGGGGDFIVSANVLDELKREVELEEQEQMKARGGNTFG